MGFAPRPFFDLALRTFASKASAVVTNVVGPRDTISIAGAPLRQAIFWVPSADRLALGASPLSYAGMIWMDFQCEAAIVSDPDVLLDGFEAEATAFRELCTEAVDGSRRDPLAARKRRLTRGVR